MKKIFLIACIFFAVSPGTKAQNDPGLALKTTSTPTVVTDVLHYYLNKHYFKTGLTNLDNYPDFMTDATGVTTSTAITYCGSKFEVPAGETVTVTGLEAYVRRSNNHVSQSIPIHLYLFTIDPSSGLPQTIIDSIVTTVSYTSTTLTGGNFTNAATFAARTLTTSFAVCVRNMGLYNGDFAHLLRTAGATQTNAAAPTSEKYSDGYGFVRYNGIFYHSTNFNLLPGFGVGTDYEFMVAPRVTYDLQASQLLPPGVVSANDLVTLPDTMCTRTVLTFTNTSSGFFEHRQYNLNQFYRKWNLYSAFPQSVNGAFAPDSSLTWHFEFYEGQPETRVFLPYVNNKTISAVTDKSSEPVCFDANEFRARLKPMAALGVGTQLIYNENFKVCFKFCNNDALGIDVTPGYENFKMYPNPLVNGVTRISGLKSRNTILVYDLLGQIVSKEITENGSAEINLSKHGRGTYLVKIVNPENQVKVVKIMNEK